MPTTPRSSVLLVGTREDPHVSRVEHAIMAQGIAAFVLDRHDPSCRITLTLSAQEIGGVLECFGKCIELREVGSIWWRLKPNSIPEFTGVYPSCEEAFTNREWRVTLKSLPAFLPDRLWVNPLAAQDSVNHKPAQLLMARSLGITVPRTRITNDVASVRDLLRDTDNRAAYKVVSSYLAVRESGSTFDGRTIYTTEISDHDIEGAEESLRLAPGQFQEMVEKEYELRITIVGDDVFCARINSQDNRSARTDWRRAQFDDNMYQRTEIPSRLRDKLLSFHRHAGLVFGAYDLIQRSNGECVFLECNPGGQWLWLEDLLGLQITDAVAKLLVRAVVQSH